MGISVEIFSCPMNAKEIDDEECDRIVNQIRSEKLASIADLEGLSDAGGLPCRQWRPGVVFRLMRGAGGLLHRQGRPRMLARLIKRTDNLLLQAGEVGGGKTLCS